MLTDSEIKREIRAATAEKIMTASSYGKGAGVLKLRIRPGARSTTAVWVASWKQGGQRGSKQLGRYPDLSLADARRKYADEIAPLVSAGKKPRQKPTAVKATVERVFEGYVGSMRARGKTSADEVERALLRGFANAADGLGRNRLAGDIEAADVVDYVSSYYKRGCRAQADKARAYIVAAYNWAMRAENDYMVETRQHWGVKFNPAAALQKDHAATLPRDRNLTTDELRELWAATLGFRLETGGLIRLLIATGQRVEECLRLEGREIDLRARLWNMPAHKTKIGLRPHSVPLPAQIIPTLERLIAKHGDGYLFASRTGSKTETMKSPAIMHAITRWLAKDGVTVAPFQTRDLRRTWKSRAADAGVDRFIRDLIQQHAQGDIGSVHYDRADYAGQMRAGMDKWDLWLRRNITGTSQLAELRVV